MLMTTLVLVVSLLTLIVGTFLLWAWSLKLGLTWVNAEGVTFRNAMLVGFVMYLLHIVAGVGLRLIAPAALQNILLLELIELALLVGIAMAVISIVPVNKGTAPKLPDEPTWSARIAV